MAQSWDAKLREWNYDPTDTLLWLWDMVQYNAERFGPIAYLVAGGIVLTILLWIPFTRSMTQALCSGVFKVLMTYVQIVGALLTVHMATFLARAGLTMFHRCHRWIYSMIQRARDKEA